jgi:hypothetical protein
MNKLQVILRSKLSIQGTELDEVQKTAAYAAMVSYASAKIEEYRALERKRLVAVLKKTFPALYLETWKFKIRRLMLKKSIEKAQVMADTEGYKVYVIRSTEVTYKLMTTLDVDQNKRMRVFGKNVDAIELTKTAAFTATRKIHPPVLKRK